MTAKTRTELQAAAVQIRDETATAANTATRVGTALLDMVDSMDLGASDAYRDYVSVIVDANVASLANEQILNGYDVRDLERVLLTGQTDPIENGPWIVHTGAAWTRPVGITSLPPGALFHAAQVYDEEEWWYLTNDSPATIGTDALNFGPVDTAGPLTTVALPGSVAAIGAANTVLTTDGVTPGGAWAKIAEANVTAGTLTNTSISDSAAVAGTKIDPDFGAQNVITTGDVSVGATPATAGDLRVNHGFQLQGRASGAADRVLFDWGNTTTDQLWIGEAGIGAINFGQELRMPNEIALTGEIAATGTFRNLIELDSGDVVQVGDAAEPVTITGTTVTLSGPVSVNNDITWTTGASTPSLTQAAMTGAGTGQTMLLQAQGNTAGAGAKIGGVAAVRGGDVSGAGTNTGGICALRAGDATGGTTNTGGVFQTASGQGATADGDWIAKVGSTTFLTLTDDANSSGNQGAVFAFGVTVGTATDAVANGIGLANNQALQSEVAATGSFNDLIKLDASDDVIVGGGAAGFEITASRFRLSVLGIDFTGAGTRVVDSNAAENLQLQYNGSTLVELGSSAIGLFGVTPVARPAAYTRTATVVTSRTLSANASATAANNNAVIAQMLADFYGLGALQGT